MNWHDGIKLWRLVTTVAATTLVLGGLQPAFAENNTGTGDVAGDPAALADSNVFVLNSTGANLTLVKTAFMTSDGSPIASGSTVPTGTMVDFMIYVNNLSSVVVNDINIQDVLDPLFVYQAGTIRVDNSVVNCAAQVCNATEEGNIYTAAAGAAASSDGVDADSASFNGGNTVDVGTGTGNGQQNAAANRVLALVFTVQVQ